jgi:hypothetical protein
MNGPSLGPVLARGRRTSFLAGPDGIDVAPSDGHALFVNERDTRPEGRGAAQALPGLWLGSGRSIDSAVTAAIVSLARMRADLRAIARDTSFSRLQLFCILMLGSAAFDGRIVGDLSNMEAVDFRQELPNVCSAHYLTAKSKATSVTQKMALAVEMQNDHRRSRKCPANPPSHNHGG